MAQFPSCRALHFMGCLCLSPKWRTVHPSICATDDHHGSKASRCVEGRQYFTALTVLFERECSSGIDRPICKAYT